MALNPLQSPVTADVLNSGDGVLDYNLYPQAQQQTTDPRLTAAFTAASRGQSVFPTYAARVQAEGLADAQERGSTVPDFTNAPLVTQGATADMIAKQQLARGRMVSGINSLSFLAKNPQEYQNFDDARLQYKSTGGIGDYVPANDEQRLTPVTPSSLLNNPNFSAILQKDPRQAQALFTAFTGNDLGTTMQQLRTIHQDTVKSAETDLRSKIQAGNFRHDEKGMPQIAIQNPVTGGKTWLSVDDPNNNLPVETAIQLLNPEARARVGLDFTPQNAFALNVLTAKSKGLSPEQAVEYAKQQAMGSGQGQTAEQLARLQLQSPVQPSSSETPVNYQDLQGKVQSGQGDTLDVFKYYGDPRTPKVQITPDILKKAAYDTIGGDTTVNFMSGVGNTLHNMYQNIMGGNLQDNSYIPAGNELNNYQSPTLVSRNLGRYKKKK